MRYPKLVAALAALTLTVGGLALAGPALAADEPVPAPTSEVASSPDTPAPTDQTPSVATSPSSTGPLDTPSAEGPTSVSAEPLAESPAVPTPPTETTAAPGSSAKAPAPSSTSVDTTAKASPSESSAAKPGKGHDPVVLCHKPGTPAQQTLTVDDNAVKGHLGHGDTLGECAPVVTPPVAVPVEGWWIMPNGGTADNVTWSQTATPAGSVPCGVTAQVDLYPSQAVLDALAADGILTQGEDYSTVISWRFVYGGDCPPPTPGPANPAATIAVQCGLGTVTATNDGENLLTASVAIYLDGDFLTALAVPAGETVTTPVGFAEDSGDHVLSARTGPAFGDVELATATVSSDCIEPPVVVVPPTEPVVTPPATPTVTPSVVPDVTPAPVAVETVSAERLASTGSDTDAERVIVWVAAALVLAGIVVLLVIRRRTPKQK